jgi:hypothetical protein
MASEDRHEAARRFSDDADRFDELAEVAELMGDEPTARRLRSDAARCRDRAMSLLD